MTEFLSLHPNLEPSENDDSNTNDAKEKNKNNGSLSKRRKSENNSILGKGKNFYEPNHQNCESNFLLISLPLVKNPQAGQLDFCL